MQAKSGDTVQIHYTGRLKDNSVFDSSTGREPLRFQLGCGTVIAGFDEAVRGMQVGEKKAVLIPVAKAYGPRQADLVLEVGREEFPPEIVPVLGLKIELMQPNGEPIPVTVTALAEQTVTLDANPPLAGQELHFDLELVAIDR